MAKKENLVWLDQPDQLGVQVRKQLWHAIYTGWAEIEFFYFKKRFPDSGKACVLKRKVTKIAFCDFSLQYKTFPESGKRFFALISAHPVFNRTSSTFGELMSCDRAQNFEHFCFTAPLENLTVKSYELNKIAKKNFKRV
jgi:hypothetical protein